MVGGGKWEPDKPCLVVYDTGPCGKSCGKLLTLLDRNSSMSLLEVS
jgi:hypothetical protein